MDRWNKTFEDLTANEDFEESYIKGKFYVIKEPLEKVPAKKKVNC